MHNIKDIRNNFENFKNQIKDRNFDANLDDLLVLDKENRTLIQVLNDEKWLKPNQTQCECQQMIPLEFYYLIKFIFQLLLI